MCLFKWYRTCISHTLACLDVIPDMSLIVMSLKAIPHLLCFSARFRTHIFFTTERPREALRVRCRPPHGNARPEALLARDGSSAPRGAGTLCMGTIFLRGKIR